MRMGESRINETKRGRGEGRGEQGERGREGQMKMTTMGGCGGCDKGDGTREEDERDDEELWRCDLIQPTQVGRLVGWLRTPRGVSVVAAHIKLVL